MRKYKIKGQRIILANSYLSEYQVKCFGFYLLNPRVQQWISPLISTYNNLLEYTLIQSVYVLFPLTGMNALSRQGLCFDYYYIPNTWKYLAHDMLSRDVCWMEKWMNESILLVFWLSLFQKKKKLKLHQWGSY